jgi:hypothetical protein
MASKTDNLFGAFSKLQKATLIFIMSVLLSVCMELGFHSTDFREI